jgi:cytochrome P450
MTVPEHIARSIVDPKAYGDGSVLESFRWLRANDPFARIDVDKFNPFRVLTRYADVQSVGRRSDEFTNAPYSVLGPKASQQKMRELSGGTTLVKTLIDMDGAEHAAYRDLTAAWFQPGNLKKLEGRVRELARGAVDQMMATGGQCDFVNEIALHYPLLVIMEILGLPEEDEPLMLKLTQELFGATDPELNERGTGSFNVVDEDQEIDMTTILELMAYFQTVTEDRRRKPTDDLTSLIANARIGGAPVPDVETMGYYIITATAGHDTTSSSTAGAMWKLAENPDQLRMVKQDPALIGGLIDEAIRWFSPVNHFMRTAVRDTEIAGQPIAAGEWLMLSWLSANRDESVFEDADAFRVDRKPNRHVAFGYGPHLCLGQYLARMEMRILFEELLPRIRSVELAGEPAMSEAVFVNGPKRLPIRFEMA